MGGATTRRIGRRRGNTALLSLAIALLGAVPAPAGADFDPWRSLTALGDYAIWSIVIDPSTPATLYAGSPHGFGELSKSMDYGAHWAVLDTGFPQFINVPAMAIDPLAPATVYAGTLNGVLKTVDGGGHWDAINTGLPDLASLYVLTIDPIAPATLYVGCTSYVGAVGDVGAGVYKSIDGGAHWTPASTGLPDPEPFFVTCLAVDQSTPSTLYAGTRDHGVYKSIDAATHWAPASTDFADTYVSSIAIDPDVPTTVYAGWHGGVLKSMDAGAHWTAMNAGLALNVTTMAIDRTRPGTLYAGGLGDLGGRVFRSRDGAATWEAFDRGFEAAEVITLVIDPTGATLYAGTQRGLHSRDLTAATTTTSTTLTGATTSTTVPCSSAACIIESTLVADACEGRPIPPTVVKRFHRAVDAIEQAAASATTKKRTKLLKNGRRFLQQAKSGATKAARGKKAKITMDCAAALRRGADELLAGLSS